MPVNKVVAYEGALHAHAREKFNAVIEEINASGDFNDEIAAKLKGIVEDFAKSGAY